MPSILHVVVWNKGSLFALIFEISLAQTACTATFNSSFFSIDDPKFLVLPRKFLILIWIHTLLHIISSNFLERLMDGNECRLQIAIFWNYLELWKFWHLTAFTGKKTLLFDHNFQRKWCIVLRSWGRKI